MVKNYPMQLSNEGSPMFQCWLMLHFSHQSIEKQFKNSVTLKTPHSRQVLEGFKRFAIQDESQPEDHPKHSKNSLDRKQSQELTDVIHKNQIFNQIEPQRPADEDYFPQQVYKKKEKSLRQNSNRNVYPNSIHQILSLVQKRKKSQTIVTSAFRRVAHDSQWTLSRYYLYQMRLKEKVTHHVNEESLKMLNMLLEPGCEVFSEEEQLFYLKVNRIVVHQYLRGESTTAILTSKRMSQNKKKNHLNVMRYLHEKMNFDYRECQSVPYNVLALVN